MNNIGQKRIVFAIIFVSLFFSQFFPIKASADVGALAPVGGSMGFSVGQADFHSIVVDSNGVPYVAYKNTSADLKIIVKKFSGGSWVTVGNSGFSIGTARYTSIALDSNGVPYVAFEDLGDSFKASVMKLDGDTWVYVGSSGITPGRADFVTLEIDSNDVPYIAFTDDTQASKISVMKYNGSSWVNVGSPGFSAGVAIGNDMLDIDSSNSLYVGYKDGGNSNKATVMKFDGASWNALGSAGFTTSLVGDIFIGLDNNDVPHVAFADSSAEGNFGGLTVKKYNGSSWVTVGTGGISTSGIFEPGLAFDSSNRVYAAYFDDVDSSDPSINVKRFNGTSWETVGTAGEFGGSSSFVDVTIAINENDIGYVSYNYDVDQFDSTDSRIAVAKIITTPTILYSGTFTESTTNNGSLKGSRVANVYIDTFVNAGSTLTQNTHYTISNKPTGLTPVVTVNGSGTTATLTFTGSASSHATTSSISNLGITFLDGALTTNSTVSSVEGYSDTTGEVNFLNPYFNTRALYGVDGSGNNLSAPHLYTLDYTTGDIETDIGAVGFNVTGLAFHPETHVLYGVNGGNGNSPRALITISTTTGAGTLLGIIKDGSNTTLTIPDIAFKSDGVLYGVASVSGVGKLYTIDPTTCDGTLDTNCLATLVGSTGISFPFGSGIAFNLDDELYFFGDGDDDYFKINSSDASVMSNPSFSNPSGEGYSISAASFDGTDTLYASRLNFGSDPTDLISIDLDTSTITSPGDNSDMLYMDAITFLLEDVPVEEDEPDLSPSPSPSPSPSSSPSSRKSGSRAKYSLIQSSTEVAYTESITSSTTTATSSPEEVMPVTSTTTVREISAVVKTPVINSSAPSISITFPDVVITDSKDDTSDNNLTEESSIEEITLTERENEIAIQPEEKNDFNPSNPTVVTLKFIGLIAGIIYLLSYIFSQPITIADIPLVPARAFNLVAFGLGIRRRPPPWGVVYDSVTKRPIDPAIIRVRNEKGEIVGESMTDIDGRYGFLLPPGLYTLEASKTNYRFPSRKLYSQSKDIIYDNLYFGEKITITHSNPILKRDIPLDPLSFDWNEFAKSKLHLTNFNPRWRIVMSSISNIVFFVGFVTIIFSIFVDFNLTNLILLGMYLFIELIKMFTRDPRSYGSIINAKTKIPSSFALLKVYTKDKFALVNHKVADKYGRYFCLVSNGEYDVVIEEKNDDESYSTSFEDPNFVVKKGIIRKNFKL
jgi:hypothetical protein